MSEEQAFVVCIFSKFSRGIEQYADFGQFIGEGNISEPISNRPQQGRLVDIGLSLLQVTVRPIG